jgi:hypothetical protein|tara:strand:- start:8339 stop:8893 length:555 start_codon:yes stop_codon:yes gene_type:complete
MSKRIFRFDDICINANMEETIKIAEYIKEKIPSSEVIFCVSPLVHDMSAESGRASERIFPKILNAHSDFRKFFKVDNCGIPKFPDWISRAGHGLIHVDHRLLEKSVQELSILTSCSLAKASIFVPPFNKWNSNTEDICKEHGIKLVQFEDGWLCCEYNKYNPKHNLWYIHAREFTFDSFKKWLV